MLLFLYKINPIYLALIAGFFCWSITSLGSAMVVFFKKVNKNIMDSLLSLSAGIMLSASFFSLLEPSISIANEMKQNLFIVVFGGFFLGGLFIYLCNKIIEKFPSPSAKKNHFKRCFLLMSSITLHNIPEGLAVGVAYGALLSGSSLVAALSLTLGIAIQNFPEGSAISLPLRRDGFSRWHSCLFGILSGIVEPISALIGALLVLKVRIILPIVLSFAAGAMLFVTVIELIPESQANKKKDLMALILLLGFGIMMGLELLLG